MTDGSPSIEEVQLDIRLSIPHRIVFGRGLFRPGGEICLQEALADCRRVLAVIEESVVEARPELATQLQSTLLGRLVGPPMVLPGGEEAKEGEEVLRASWNAIEAARIDRHSAVLCIGGGAFLDAVGFAAATAHRGVRLVRVPTTTLAQDDSGVGVKNGINAFGKKNFLGCFAVPHRVLIDFDFLATQPVPSRRGGYVEAVKVALVRDAAFFDWLEIAVPKLRRFEPAAEEELVRRSAILHARHIAEGGDPFESGNSRPLDFGHWSAHKLEKLTELELGHGEAVAIGVALDTLYSARVGLLEEAAAERVLALIKALDLPLWHPALARRDSDGRLAVLAGLEEFREHLGGDLCVLLLEGIGRGVDAHEFDHELIARCIDELATR